MGELSSYSTRNAAAAGTSPKAGGAGANVAEGQWSGHVTDFDDLKALMPTGGGRIVTDSVEDDKRVRRSRATGRHFMRRIGWQSRYQSIVLVVSERDVLPQPDGRFKPSGEWKIIQISEHNGVGPVKERTGDVVDDSLNPELAKRPGTHGQTSGNPAVPSEKQFASAHKDLQYLPRAVRAGVLKLVPSPTFFHCQALRFSTDGAPTHHTVSVLRMTEENAVVILASRQQGAGTWQVQQLSYKLEPVSQTGQLPANAVGEIR